MFKDFTLDNTLHWRFQCKQLGLLLIFLPLNISAQQAADCLNAIPVCTNTYNQPVSASGFGNAMEISSGTTCLTNGETNSTWYIFKIQSAGTLLFQIDPLNAQDDYDYILYDLSNDNCTDILNGNLQPTRCNYSSSPGSTGLLQGITDNSNPASGPNQCAPLIVQADQAYALMVNNFTATNSGYTLTFSGSAIIYDTQSPTFDEIDAPSCSPKKVVLKFSEDIKCASVALDGTDFQITGPSAVTISSASIAGCNNSVLGTTIKLHLSSPIQTLGTYTVKIKTGSDGNTVADFCDNMIPSGTSLTFTVENIGPSAEVVTTIDQTCTVLGSATASVTGGTPPFSYSWDTNPIQTTLTASNLEHGEYEFEVTDANGCIAIAETDVHLTGMPEVDFDVTAVRCDSLFSGEATVNVTGGMAPYQYLWQTQPPQTTQTITGITTGNYVVTVTTADGCEVQDTVALPLIGLPELALSQTNVACNGLTLGTADVDATGNAPFTYEWNTSPLQFTSHVSDLPQGSYTVTVTDSVGCISSATVNIGLGGMTLTPSVTDLTCATVHNGIATVAASNGLAPYNYEWNTDPVQYGPTASQLAEGNYIVTVTDSGGCIDTLTVAVDAPPAIIISISTQDAGCGLSDGSATINVAGGFAPYTYNWTSLAQTDTIITGQHAGIYPVEVTDTSGCVAEAHAYIANPDGPAGFITDVIDATCEYKNGSASVTNVTGNGPFTYMWDTSPLQYAITATGLDENIYYVMITDVNSCVSFLHVKINRTPQAMLMLTTSQNASCSHADGVAEVQAEGGLAPYGFSWNTNPVQYTSVASGLMAGNYNVILTDGNNCKDTLAITIGENKAVNDFSFSAACIDQPVYFSGITNYTGNASWTWDFGDGSVSSSLQSATDHVYSDTSDYNVKLYINGGCATDTLVRTVRGAYKPLASFDAGTEKLYATAAVQFNYTGSGVISYRWDFGDGNFSDEHSPIHVYSNPQDSANIILQVTDGYGCMDTASMKLFVEVPPVFYLPNSFTPNGDGLNDYFNIPSTGMRSCNMKIFNRWGEEVYSSANLNELVSRGWDGNFKGTSAPDGSYTYILDATLENDVTRSYKGSVTLIH